MQLRYAMLCVLVAASQAHAQVAETELEEVVVTASRVDQKKSDIPVTINVVTEQEIDKVKYRNPDEILRRIPGIYSHNFSGESELSSIRIPTHFTNPYTLLLIDGVPTASYGSGSSGNFRELNSSNIARVEIVKGPSSAIYGSNAIGGVINIITKDAAPEQQAKLWTEFGAYDQWRSTVSASGSSESLSYFGDISITQSDNWREHAEVDKQAANIKLRYVPTDEGLLTFKIDYVKFDNESPGSIEEEDFLADWRQSYHTFAYNKLEKISPLISYTHYLDQAEIKGTLVLRDISQESIPNYAIRRQGPINYVGEYDETDSRDIDGQFIYSRDFDFMRSKIITGVDIEHGDTQSKQYTLSVVYDSGLNKYTDYTNTGLDDDFDITTRLYAPYFQIEISPFEKLRLTAGGRYDDVTYEVDSKVDPAKSGDKDFSRFTSKFGAVYQLLTNCETYFNISEGFVVPTTSQLLTSSWANSALQPEEAMNYEVGFRSTLLENKASIDVAVYWMEIENKIIARELSAYSKEYVNAGETLQKGLEIVGSYSLFDNLKLSAAYTYARNTFEKYSPGTEDYTDNDLPRSPHHRLNLRLNYQPINNLNLEIEMDKMSSQYADDANSAKYSRPTLLNLRANYTWEDWGFWAYLENLTDEEYATYISYSSSNDTATYYSGNPITVFAGLSYRW